MIFSVSNSAGVSTALKYAAGGDTIVLQGGAYDALTINGLVFDAAVTIVSAGADRPAVLASLTVNQSQFLTFRNIEIATSGTGITMGADKNITLDGLDVHNAVADERGGNGLKITDSSDVTVINSNFHNLGDALSHVDTNNLVISGNRFHDLGADGVHGGGSSNVLIANNTFTDFITSPGKHPDAIQFWTTYTTSSAHDIVVRDNLIVRGEGAGMQGIFITDQSGGKVPYENLTITGNMVVGGFYHGLTVYDANHVLIDGNTVIGYADMDSWIMAYETDGATLTNNTTSHLKITSPNTNLTSNGNQVVGRVSVQTDDALIDSWLAAHPQASLGVQTFAQVAFANPYADAMQVFIGDTGANVIEGTAGADLLDGKGGLDTLSGGAGNDLYAVGDTADRIVEQSNGGTDTVQSSVKGQYQLDANIENLTLAGSTGQKGVGNELDNVLQANSVQSTLVGGAGADTLISVGGIDTFTGGIGRDVFRFDKAPATPTVITDFADGEDALDLRGLLHGYAGSNPVADKWVAFQTEGSTTTVYVDADGPGGASGFTAVAKLTGVLATEDIEMVGGGSSGASRATVTVGQTVIMGTVGNDVLVANTSSYVRGDLGNDTLTGGAAFDDINGNAGDDLIRGGGGGDWVVGGKDNDQIFGDAGADMVLGNLGNDTCDGGTGNDVIRGGQGNDSVAGGAGDDFVSGDRGDDTISGGAGADRFHGSQDAGLDRITDFNQADGDRVVVDFGTTYTVSQVGVDTVIDMGGGHRMILENVQMSTLPTGWIFEG